MHISADHAGETKCFEPLDSECETDRRRGQVIVDHETCCIQACHITDISRAPIELWSRSQEASAAEDLFALAAWHKAPAPMPDGNLLDQLGPNVEFDQRVARSSPLYAGDDAAALVRQPSTASPCGEMGIMPRSPHVAFTACRRLFARSQAIVHRRAPTTATDSNAVTHSISPWRHTDVAYPRPTARPAERGTSAWRDARASRGN